VILEYVGRSTRKTGKNNQNTFDKIYFVFEGKGPERYKIIRLQFKTGRATPEDVASRLRKAADEVDKPKGA
jgi:hypothetical protein